MRPIQKACEGEKSQSMGGAGRQKLEIFFLRMCGMGGSEKLGDESRAQGTQEEGGLHSLVLPFPSCARA